MYKHILLPTDGSALSEKANVHAIALAKALGARLTVFHASPEYPTPIVAEGAWEGDLVLEPRGNGGFGYDPYFQPWGSSRTAAELHADEKNRVSHRALAAAALMRRLKP